MYSLLNANRIKIKENAYKASLFSILKFNNYYRKH
jgi:hypothetical protein